MHELGVVIEVVRTVEEFARENSLTAIDALVLQIGELSSIVPRYVEECYPAAVDGTLMENTRLDIEILPGNAMCGSCGKVFNLLASEKKCPECDSGEWEILGGREFLIKEIVAC